MRKFVIVLALASMLALTACGSSASSGGSSAASVSESSGSAASASSESSGAQQEADFDGSAFSDTGAGKMYLVTAGGTSEDGSVPQVAGMKDPYNSAMSIELDYFGGDGSVCTVYVDGIENTKINAGDVQTTIGITGETLEEGVHTVEVVKMDGDRPAIYKKAQYEIVL